MFDYMKPIKFYGSILWNAVLHGICATFLGALVLGALSLLIADSTEGLELTSHFSLILFGGFVLTVVMFFGTHVLIVRFIMRCRVEADKAYYKYDSSLLPDNNLVHIIGHFLPL